MRAILSCLCILLILFSSCKNQGDKLTETDYAGFTEKNVTLVGFNKEIERTDTIGIVSIKIPARLDTFYQWHSYSDCISCGSFRYRFADSNYPQFAEAGMFWTNEPDSTYQLTLAHNEIRQAPDSIDLKPLTIEDTNRYYSHGFLSHSNIKYFKREFKNINGNAFIISRFITPYGDLTQDSTLYLIATTHLKKRKLDVIAECGAKDTTGFLDNMYKVLMSIKIQEK